MASPQPGKSGDKNTDDDGSTRERILDHALEAFAELGFDGASTRAIAARAGVNQGLIAYYFGSKDKLWREAVTRAFASLRRGVGDAGALAGVADHPDELAGLIRRYVRFVAQHPEFVKLMNEEGKREGPRMEWLVDTQVRPLFDALTRTARTSADRGNLPADLDPLHFFYIFAGAVGLLFHQAPECRRLTGTDPMDERVIDAHADALVHLFLGPGAAGSRKE